MPIPTAEHLIALANANELAAFMASRFGHLGREDVNKAAILCAELHNEGKLDLLAIIHSPSFAALQKGEFFFAQDAMNQAIPILKTAWPQLLGAIDALVTQGGGDGAAARPLSALKSWLSANASEAEAIVASAEAGDDRAARHLGRALQALADLDRARSLAKQFNDDRGLAAVSALGAIAHTPEETRQTYLLFSALHESDPDNDPLNAELCNSTIALADAPNAPLEEAKILAGSLVAKAGDFTRHACAHALWVTKIAHADKVLASILLAPLANVNPERANTVLELDFALAALLGAGNEDLAIEFATRLLAKPPPSVGLSDLGSFSSALETSHVINRALIAWLRTGLPSLCEGMVTMITGGGDRNRALSVPVELLSLPARERLYVCRKAVGYFFFYPVTAASIIVSALRLPTDEATAEIAELLFMPLLQNYAGALRTYLESIDNTDAAYPHVQRALDRDQSYLNGLRQAESISEMAPSEHQRMIEHMRRRDEAAQTWKAAREQSVLMKFIKQSTILHGNRSLSYIADGGDLRSFEMDLQPQEYSIDSPRMLVTDPVGIDYLLRRYRAEEPPP